MFASVDMAREYNFQSESVHRGCWETDEGCQMRAAVGEQKGKGYLNMQYPGLPTSSATGDGSVVESEFPGEHKSFQLVN